MTTFDPYASLELSAALPVCEEIRAHALDFEAAKQLPAGLVRKLNLTGLFRMPVAAIYGGSERSAAQIVRAIEEISYADGSAGWCAMVYMSGAFLSGLLPGEWAHEIYGNGAMPLIAGSSVPTGLCQSKAGGVMVNGRWGMVSGAHNSDWLCGGGYLMDGNNPPRLATGEPRVHFMLFERTQAILHDNWDPSGLIGTGSVDFEVKDAFVPEGRWVILGETKPSVDGPLYRISFFSLLAATIGAVPIGIARRAIDCFVELANGKVPTWMKDTLAKNPIAQAGIGRAEALIAAGRDTLYASIDELWDCTARGDEPPLELRRRLRLAAAFATEASAGAVDILFAAGGRSSLQRTNPLQRCFRDIHAITQHRVVSAGVFETAGKLKLRGERPMMML